ncbi:MAG: phosphoadenosine phosphosulfate reductase [Roseobacter sp.]
MSETIVPPNSSLSGLKTEDWISEAKKLVHDKGYLARLGKRQLALYRPRGKTLLVSFETHQGIQTLSPKSHPMGWELLNSNGWSSLSLISNGDTWFRDPEVYSYFDKLIDDGFFDAFNTVLFYGAGPCGYAAAAFSVAAPSALVLSVQPQATLAPHLTEWDRRFPEQRRLDFTTRYGYAPHMVEAAHRAFVIYDPTQTEDAMHAALFKSTNVTKLRAPRLGASLQTDLLQMGVLFSLIECAGENLLTPARFSKFLRARRNHLPYLQRLLAHIDENDRPELAGILCNHVTARMNAPRFERRLTRLADQVC